MRERIGTLLLALVLLASLGLGTLPAQAAETYTITLRVHYFREDGKYDGRQLWLWTDDTTLQLDPPYYFEQEGDEMVATVQITPGTMRVGYLVRSKSWENMCIETGLDRYIDLDGVACGTVDVYIRNDEENSEIVYGEDVLWDPVIVAAKYKAENSDGLPQIVVKMTALIEESEVTTDTFSVYNWDGKVNITAVKAVNNYYYLTLAQQLDPMRGYLVGFEDETGIVAMPDIYGTEDFENKYTYTGNDLGATYTPDKTTLRLWAPTALEVQVNLYNTGNPETEPDPVSVVPLKADVQGTWVCELPGDMNGTYYTYQVTLDTKVAQTCDPYARTTGANGERGMIVDLASTNPEGWAEDTNPNASLGITDAVIYELSVRDLSADTSSGITHKGQYLGLTEKGTKNAQGISTGLDYISDLGITHVQLLPVYDFAGVDETAPYNKDEYNWGYNPVNYNVPEGSYSSDPAHGEVRVKEFKQMVKSLHDQGISVVMDVVYNHVNSAGSFCFNQAVPGYFSRPGSNGSDCGNDTASERVMVRKYIVDSVNYWVEEYHIDGFRFDLVGLLDTDTINEVVKTVHEKHPDVIFYGEGWTMQTSLSKPGYTLCTQPNAAKVPQFAFFNDTFRNAIRGGSFDKNVSAGYISGADVSTDVLNQSFMGMAGDWCTDPTQSINYLSCHDNHTLYDQITLVTGNASEQERIDRNKLGAAFTLTAQGVPFFQAGEEILRSKPKDGGFDHNSYKSSDDVNAIKWDTLSQESCQDVYAYYKGLIAFRKMHPALRLTDGDAVKNAVKPVTGLPAGVAAYQIQGGINGETADGIFCAFNASQNAATITLPEGEWYVYVNKDTAGTEVIEAVSGEIQVAPLSAMVLTNEKPVTPPTPPETEPTEPTEPTQPTEPVSAEQEPTGKTGLTVALIVIAVAGAASAVILVSKRKRETSK